MSKSIATPLAQKERKNEIDILKGFGIIFVIIGHMGSPLYGGDSVLSYVYTFHMPLFFIVIGYLAIKISGLNRLEHFRKRALGLLLPYCSFFLFSFLWTEIVFASSQGYTWFSFPTTWHDMIQAFVLSGGYLNGIPISNFPLWFLPLCFLATLVFYEIIRTKNLRFVVFMLAIVIFMAIPLQETITGRPAWHINALPTAVTFMLIGYLVRHFSTKNSLMTNSLVGIILIIIGYTTALLCGNGANIANIKTPLYFISAVISTYGYYMLASESRNKYLAFVGKNSLHFFALHALVLIMLPIVKIDQYFIKIGQDGVIIYAIQLLTTLLLTSVLVVLLMQAVRYARRVGEYLRLLQNIRLRRLLFSSS